jgi:ATP-dependent exoDNAse (exonuclease V) beta subunit
MMNQIESSVRPGLHGAVVWWDPLALNLKPPDVVGLRQEDILTSTQPAARESEEAYARWKFDRAAALDQGAAPSLEIVLASGTEDPPPIDMAAPKIDRIELAFKAGRPYGSRFGNLVHAILRQARAVEQIEHWGIIIGAQLQAPADEIAAALEAAHAAFEHPLLVRSRLAKEVHREMPVTLKIDGNRIFEGVIDLAFVEAGRWVIVDFKTTYDLDAHRETYARQLQWYAYALNQIRGGVEVESWILGI